MKLVKLKDITEITMGQSPEAEYVTQEKIGLPLLNGPAEFTNKFPIPVQYTSENKRVAQINDILFCVRGSTTGRMNIADQKYAIGRGLASIRHKKNSELNSYIKALIEVNLKKLLNGTLGSVFPNVTKDNLFELECYIHDCADQNKIASILTALDDKIELNNNINIELEQMAKTLYDYWFVQFDFPNEEGKPFKSSGGKMVYNKVLKREIPEGWTTESLYKIADFINGLACQKYRPLTDEDEYLPVIKIREMNDGLSSNTEKARVDVPIKNIIDDGDVLFSWSATLDIKIWTQGKGVLNQHIFKVASDKYPRSFYYFEILNYLQHFKMMAELRKTTMGHITLDHLRTSFIAIPPMNLINQLDDKLNILHSKIITSKKQNQELASLRDWLLPMLMNGQVKVAD